MNTSTTFEKIPHCADANHEDAFTDSTFHNLVGEGVKAFIHKVSEGTSFIDTELRAKAKRALSVNMLLGGYHMLSRGDVGPQVASFVKAAKGLHLLPVIDAEENEKHPERTPTLDDILNFNSWWVQTYGKTPMVYGSAYLIELLSDPRAATLRSNPFWIAKYGSDHMPVLPHYFPLVMVQYSPAKTEAHYCGVEGLDTSTWVFHDKMEEVWDRHSVTV